MGKAKRNPNKSADYNTNPSRRAPSLTNAAIRANHRCHHPSTPYDAQTYVAPTPWRCSDCGVTWTYSRLQRNWVHKLYFPPKD